MINCKQLSGDPIWESLKEEIARMAQLKNYPNPSFEPKAFKELVLVLQRECNSIPEATLVVDDLIYGTECPLPTNLSDSIKSRQERRGEGKLVCPICSGSGFLTAWLLVSYDERGFRVGKPVRMVGFDYEKAGVKNKELVNAGLPQSVESVGYPCGCRRV